MSDPLPPDVEIPRTRRRRVRRTRGNRLFLAISAGLAAAALVLLVDGVWSGRQMFRGVAAARSALGEGAVAVVTGDPGAARPFFEDATGDAGSTIAASGHPSMQLASLLPWVGDNIEAVEAVARASETTAQAGLVMVDAAEALGWHDLGLPAAEAIGSVDIRTVRTAIPALSELATRLDAAAAQLERADTGHLVGPVATGFNDARDALRRRAAIAADSRDLARFLPRFLGAGGPRTYLLAVQTLGQPQGTGGRIDLVGALEAAGGRLSMAGPFAPAGETFAATDPSPDGPSTAEALLAAASDEGLGTFDGVVLIDSVWLQDALWVTGSVEADGRTLPLTLDDGARALEVDAFEGTNLVESEAARASWASAIVESYLAARPSTEAFAIGSAKDVSERHLIIYSTEPREQALLARLGATGTVELGMNPLAVTWNSLVDNHAVLFTERSIVHSVAAKPDGSARVRTVVDVENRAANGPPSVLLGLPLPAIVEEPGGVNPVGGFAAEVRVALSRSAAQIALETSVPSETTVIKEDRRKTAVATMATDPGDSLSLILNYVVERAFPEGERRLSVVVVPQPSFAPDRISVRLEAPGGATVTAAHGDMERAGASATYVGEPSAPLTLWIRW